MRRRDINRRISRRNVLKTGAAASIIGLSGCLGDDDPGDDDTTPPPADDDVDDQDPPERVEPYLDQLPDYYPDSYWQIIDNAMDEETMEVYTAHFAAFAEEVAAFFTNVYDFADVNLTTLPTARVLPRWSTEASRGEHIPDNVFTYDPVANMEFMERGLAVTDYESPERQHYMEEHYTRHTSLFGSHWSFNVPCWNPAVMADNGYESREDVPFSLAEVAEEIQDNHSTWDQNFTLYDVVMSTSGWQQAFQWDDVYGRDQLTEYLEVLGSARPDAFWTASTMGNWVGEGSVMFGLGLAQWIIGPFVLPEFSEEELTWAAFHNPPTHTPPYAISANADNPNLARLYHDSHLGKETSIWHANEWMLPARRNDLPEDELEEIPIWNVLPTPSGTAELESENDWPNLPYEEIADALVVRDELREVWYQAI